MKKLTLLQSIIGILTLLGCSEVLQLDTGPIPVGSSTSTGVTSVSPLTVTLVSESSGSAGNISYGGCSFPAGSAVGATQSCSATIPEQRLFTGSLTFNLTVASNECFQVLFYPYWYMASNSATFDPFWDSSVTDATPALPVTFDCSQSSRAANPIECFSGAATKIVDSFPQFTGLRVDAGNGASVTFSVPPAASNAQEFYSNRLTVNQDLPTVDIATGSANFAGDGFVTTATAGFTSSQPTYRFDCIDEYAELRFSINYTIGEENGPNNDIPTWP